MTDSAETREFWNRVAADWQIQVGDEGDLNRRMNSDPVLWELLGEVKDRTVLDAGCGTGYLTRQLHQRGARAIGADFSEKMIQIARDRSPELDYRVDACDELATVENESVDRIVSNYVLMDVADLEGCTRAFHRVLKPGGAAVLIFSHPCFPAARSECSPGYTQVKYRWDHPYFERKKMIDPPWAHFTSEFVWFHRPLSDYWKAFRAAGFTVEEFDEPRVTPDRFHLAPTEKKLQSSLTRPFSVAFKLRK